ncbi:MAG: putative D,D-dipeptide-binding periplasmic protein DdpA [Stenotrophomonas maltophilia]|nr:MAG: putative D,D-dipeptide-binding periplasmic protein DdpA [Stenotrophomonas maltophilia]
MKRLITSLALGLLWVCTGALAQTPADVLVIARNLSAVYTFDPQEIFEIAQADALNNIYQRVVARSLSDANAFEPAVASHWQFSADSRELRLRIDSGQVFHSGRPVSAEDVVFSLQRGVRLNKSTAYLIRHFGWDTAHLDQAVRSEGNEVVLSFPRPLAHEFVLGVLASTVASVLDRQAVLAHEQDGDSGNRWLKSHSAGSGPFQLEAWKAGEAIILRAAPHWPGKPLALSRIVIRHVPDPATQKLLLERGDVDIALDLSADQVRALAGNPAVSLRQVPRSSIVYLGLNQTQPALAQPKVRQALRWLIDYQGIAADLLRGQYVVSQSVIPPGMPDVLAATPYHLDVAKAKQLLSEAGYPQGFSFDLDVFAFSPYLEIAQALQASFAQAGVQLKLNPMDTSQVLTRYRERRHQGVLFLYATTVYDPASSTEFFAGADDLAASAPSSNAAWRNQWLSPQLKQTATQALYELDPARRNALYAQVQHELLDDSPILPLLQVRDNLALRSDVQGYRSFLGFDSGDYSEVRKAR